jgi:ABC-type xylose transport system permease subunit
VTLQFVVDFLLAYAGEKSRRENHMGSLVNILWTIAVILIVLWLLGLVLNVAGGLIHLLLVIAVIVIIYNLLTSRRAV